MEIYTTEEQQVEAIKKWWHDNKWSVIGGVAIGIAALAGGRAWMDSKNTFAEAASAEYQVMLEQIASGANEEASTHGAQLLGQFADTPYAALAALAMARIKLDEGDSVAASSHLRWALDNTDQAPVKHEARLRLARVLLADNKADEALALLNGVDTGSYAPAYDQLKGDIYVAQGQPDAARSAYQSALAAMAPTAAGRGLLQMKLDDLGSAGQGSNS